VTHPAAEVTDAPPRWVRTVGLVLLGVFFFFGFSGLESWPLTGWHLFSVRREQVESSWQAYAVDPSGDEARVEWLDLPVAFRQSSRLLPEGEENCDGFLEAIGHEYPDLTEVRVYRVHDHLDDDGERTEVDRELRYACPAP
jgi:hypothetical protein